MYLIFLSKLKKLSWILFFVIIGGNSNLYANISTKLRFVTKGMNFEIISSDSFILFKQENALEKIGQMECEKAVYQEIFQYINQTIDLIPLQKNNGKNRSFVVYQNKRIDLIPSGRLETLLLNFPSIWIEKKIARDLSCTKIKN